MHLQAWAVSGRHEAIRIRPKSWYAWMRGSNIPDAKVGMNRGAGEHGRERKNRGPGRMDATASDRQHVVLSMVGAVLAEICEPPRYRTQVPSRHTDGPHPSEGRALVASVASSQSKAGASRVILRPTTRNDVLIAIVGA